MLLSNPEYAKVNGKEYKINTDFKTAIECNEIAKDETISDYERALAVIYKLFGDDGLENQEDYDELLTAGLKFLSCGVEVKVDKTEPDMDFVQDYNYIKTSFRSDYGIELKDMHWWEFMDLINGLSNSEMGNSCILNRIRAIRTYDVSKIKDRKEKEKILKAKKQVALKKKERKLSEEEEKNRDKFFELANIRKEK